MLHIDMGDIVSISSFILTITLWDYIKKVNPKQNIYDPFYLVIFMAICL